MVIFIVPHLYANMHPIELAVFIEKESNAYK